ncbi:MAG: hypothetical protein QXU69_02815 [Thermofilaceae archaeon]
MLRRLCDAKWFKGIYTTVYSTIALEGRLPPPDRIFLLDSPSEIGAWIPRQVAGLAIQEKKAVWFRSEPPHPWVFAHELIHLAWKRLYTPEEEEVFSYLLPRLVLLLVEKSIVPPANPLRLFEDVDAERLEEALRLSLGISVADLYQKLNLPHPLENPGRLEFALGRKLASDKLYLERALTILALFDIARGAGRYPELLKAILCLLQMLHRESRRQARPLIA